MPSAVQRHVASAGGGKGKRKGKGSWGQGAKWQGWSCIPKRVFAGELSFQFDLAYVCKKHRERERERERKRRRERDTHTHTLCRHLCVFFVAKSHFKFEMS